MDRQKAWGVVSSQIASVMPIPFLRSMLLFAILASASVSAQEFEYKVKYGLIQAGTAKLSLIEESGLLTSSLTIQSSPWLSNLWTLSDSISSSYQIETKKMVRHEKAIHEGGYHRRYQVDFLDSNQVRINLKVKDLDWDEILDIPSLIYVLSHSRFEEGDTLRYRLWDGRGEGQLDLLVKNPRRRTLLHPLGAEEGWELIPMSSTKKSRENGIQLSIHMSRGFPHIPERIEMDTKYGAVQMHLAGS